MPKFSIIIPVYNVAPYLKECLDSVFRASLNVQGIVEVICVDDGSSDGSGDILSRIEDVAHVEFKVIRQANQGVSAARNAALEIARGEWIWFIDGDDLVHPESLEFFTRQIDAHPDAEAVMYSGLLRGESTPKEWPSPDDSVCSEHTSRDCEAYRSFHLCVCGGILKGDIARSNRFEPYIVGEDVLYLCQLFWRMRDFVLSNATLYFYRDRAGGASNGKVSLRAVSDNINVEIKCMRDLIEKSQWTKGEKSDFIRYLFDYFLTTNKEKFLRITDSERRKVLKDWVRLQEIIYPIGPHVPFWKLSIWCAKYIRSPRLSYYLTLLVYNSKGLTYRQVSGKMFKRWLRRRK